MQLPASNLRQIAAGRFCGPFYVVVCGLHDDPYTPERNVGDTTWSGTVKDIADVQFENLLQVIELGTGRDVTERIVREAAEKRVHEGADYSHSFFKLVELHLGTRAARSLVRGGWRDMTILLVMCFLILAEAFFLSMRGVR